MKKLVLSLVSIISFSAVMVACNNGGGGSNSAVTTPNSCGSAAQSGYLYAANGSAYPVESCSSGEVMYGSSCISACSITTACGNTTGYNTGYNNGYYNNGYNNALNGNCSTTGYTGNGYVPYQNTGYVAPYYNSYNYYSTGYYNGYYGGGYNAGYPSYYQRPVGVQAGVWVNF